jgi:beta-glucosidase-like glycosyl hydrolase
MSDLINSAMTISAHGFPRSLEKRLFQMIVSRLDGNNLASRTYQKKTEALVEKGIGGFIVFGGRKKRVKQYIAALQSIADIPLFIAADVERGVGQQIEDATVLPSQMAVAAAIRKEKDDDMHLLERMMNILIDEAHEIGMNMPLIPVLDVNRDPDNPIICTRAFSDTPEDVSYYGLNYIRLLQQAGLVSCAKHFPGHGHTSVDSHISLPVINKTLDDLMAQDIPPFHDAVQAGVMSIMVGHISIPAIDKTPASLSGKAITSLLRKKLGFRGLVLTDALSMHALKDMTEIPSRCVNAGADVLLHPDDADLTQKELARAVESGKVPLQRIDESVRHIMEVKQKMLQRKVAGLDYSMHREVSASVVRKSISLYKYTPGILPLRETRDVCMVFAGDSEYFRKSPMREVFSSRMYESHGGEKERRQLRHDTREMAAETVVVGIFTSIAAWRGSAGIREEERQWIDSLIRHASHSIVISFGSPYILRNFRSAEILIAAYDVSGQAQKAVLRCLRDDPDFPGRIPVALD